MKHYTVTWREHKRRFVEEEDGTGGAAQTTENDQLLSSEFITHDGKIYPDEAIPVRAELISNIGHYLEFQARADKEAHLETQGALVPYMPKMEHAATVSELWRQVIPHRAY